MNNSFFLNLPVTTHVTGSDIDASYQCDVLVLGIGNLLWADEGFGVRAVEEINSRWAFHNEVRIMDGGTQGLYLLPYVEGCKRLLILDAVDYGLPPATIKLVENQDVPTFLGAKKMSLHQTGFQEVLAIAMMRGWKPDHMVLVGMQPEVLEDYGGSLTISVKEKLPQAIDIAIDILQKWGVEPEPRLIPPFNEEQVSFSSLSMVHYETERPSEESACRFGDDRFF
jgi:hydrogenase maturation protease